MMARALSLILVGLVSSAIAQTSISVPSIVKTDRPFVVEHASGADVQAIFAVAGADGITWQSLADEHFIRRDTETIIAAPAGDYLITTGESQIVKIVGDAKPQPRPDPVPPTPGPEPDPQPEPEPQPVDGLVWVMIFEQTTDRVKNPDFAGLMASGYWADLDAREDFEAVSYDIDSPGAAKRSQYWSGESLPVAVFATDQGKVLGKRPVRSIADLRLAIKEVTGRE